MLATYLLILLLSGLLFCVLQFFLSLIAQMVYSCSDQLIKLLLFVTNLAIFLLGGLLFGFSLWANLDRNFASHLHQFAQQTKIDEQFVNELAQYEASLWVLVAVGALLLVVGFLGCCGAACESVPLLSLFSIVVLILSLIQLFVIVLMYTDRDDLLNSVHAAFVKSAETAEGRRNLKPIEAILKCCGATIETQNTYLSEGLCPGTLASASDCYSTLAAKVGSSEVLASGIALLVVEFFSLLFASALCRAFQRRGPAYQPI